MFTRRLACASVMAALMVGSARSMEPIYYGQGPDDLAHDTLQRFLARSRSVTMSAIIVERKASTGCETVLKLEQERNGRTKVTLLQPLNLQGMVSLDDGKRWWSYHPDEARLIVQDSPRTRSEDVSFRMNLASRNYTFGQARGPQIAGRSSKLIVATPRSASMPVRRYFVDARHNVLLRLELEDPQTRERVLVMETRAIQFPRELPPGALDMQPLESVRTIELPPPIRLDRNADLRHVTGFSPILPANLPNGFVLREPELMGEGEGRMLAVRITDGLVSSTIYQWQSRKARMSMAQLPANERELSGVRIRIVSDLPSSVQERILERFTTEGARTYRWDLEPKLFDLPLNSPYPWLGLPSVIDAARRVTALSVPVGPAGLN